MKRLTIVHSIRLGLLALLLCLSGGALQAQTTSFTYQGRLTDGSNPADGSYDLQFRLFDALLSGTQVGTTLVREDVAVGNGIFTVTLDFGAGAFPGANRFLEIGVRPGTSAGAFTPLTPLQPITATPYAIRSLNAATADGLSIACVSCVTGSQISNLSGSQITGGINGSQLTLPLSLNASSSGPIVSALNTGAGNGLSGSTAGSTGRGVEGIATSAAGATTGVYGQSNSISGRGLVGFANSATGLTFGVFGQSSSISGRGVQGLATSPTGLTFGVRGESDSSAGRGVHGETTSPTGVTFGVSGQSNSSDGRGVSGLATSATGFSYGVEGRTNSTGGTGVIGQAFSNTGSTFGVQGESISNEGIGVFGSATSTTGATYGAWGRSNSGSGRGVYGEATSTTGPTSGVDGISLSTAGRGMFGWASSTTGTTYGVYGLASSFAGAGVCAEGAGPGGTALQIENGAIKVSGAGIGTGTPVFIHRATAGNIAFSSTVITHPLADGDPNAILIVTHNLNPGGAGTGIDNTRSVGVVFANGKWAIVNLDNTAMPLGAAYNVLIVKP